ncbi:MAG: hypothetical protein ACKPCI_03245, partial [Dolichospermum sp.]
CQSCFSANVGSVRICLAKGFSFDQISGGLCQETPPPNPLPASEEGGQELREEGGQELSGEREEGGQELGLGM